MFLLCWWFTVRMATSHREYFKSKGDTPTKPVEGRTKEDSIDDFRRLCGVNFKIKFDNFQKSTIYISMENFVNLLDVQSEMAKH